MCVCMDYVLHYEGSAFGMIVELVCLVMKEVWVKKVQGAPQRRKEYQ